MMIEMCNAHAQDEIRLLSKKHKHEFVRLSFHRIWQFEYEVLRKEMFIMKSSKIVMLQINR